LISPELINSPLNLVFDSGREVLSRAEKGVQVAGVQSASLDTIHLSSGLPKMS
jgi:hypothetical protein